VTPEKEAGVEKTKEGRKEKKEMNRERKQEG